MYFSKFYKNLGLRIKVLREFRHLSQKKLAEKSGISLDYLGKIEVGINKPGLVALLKIASGLEISMEELFKTL